MAQLLMQKHKSYKGNYLNSCKHQLLCILLCRFILVVVMFGFGCSVDFKKMFHLIKSPKEFLTGITLQILLFPCE